MNMKFLFLFFIIAFLASSVLSNPHHNHDHSHDHSHDHNHDHNHDEKDHDHDDGHDHSKCKEAGEHNCQGNEVWGCKTSDVKCNSLEPTPPEEANCEKACICNRSTARKDKTCVPRDQCVNTRL